MSTLVKFPIAKLLKEKGYNEQCGMLFDENGVPSGTKMSMGGNPNNYINKYSAPTIDDVKWWLYEKHGIWITVERHEPKALFNYVIVYQDGVAIKESRGRGYKHPTEAYEAAIEYVLNNLI